MVRLMDAPSAMASGAPHPRGDGPSPLVSAPCRRECSPPAWGWSGTSACQPFRRRVLPTRVGMVRTGQFIRSVRRCAPHPRGDGPHDWEDQPCGCQCSPPAWGWSGAFATLGGDSIGAPHPRGDGPLRAVHSIMSAVCSPPAWGWSSWRFGCGGTKAVLPTRVGMVRCEAPVRAGESRAPHPRGDGPPPQHGDG